jgi:thioredoxin reductase
MALVQLSEPTPRTTKARPPHPRTGTPGPSPSDGLTTLPANLGSASYEVLQRLRIAGFRVTVPRRAVVETLEQRQLMHAGHDHFNAKIDFIWNTHVIDVVGEEGVEGLTLENVETGKRSRLDVEGLFVAIGHEPNTRIFQGWLDMDETGYLKVTPGTTKTNIKGIFASGDAADKHYRQAVTAAGTGCMAALDA